MITQVIDIVKNASELMTTDITIEQKGNESNYVTSADKNIQLYLEEQLTALIPNSTFLGEESVNGTIEGDCIWVVDPIDGTWQFIFPTRKTPIYENRTIPKIS